MTQMLKKFGEKLANWASQTFAQTLIDENDSSRILVKKDENHYAAMEMTPIEATACNDSVCAYFNGAHSIDHIIDVYRKLKSDYLFEDRLPNAMHHVHPYASYFLDRVFSDARLALSADDARLIIDWVKDLDAYTCVKAIESLFYSKADLKLLHIADQQNWQIHFDHLAIRCGNQANRDAERVVEFLKSEHGYTEPQLSEQFFYQFSDGWNAYVLFKILTNGQSILLFIDQSDIDHPEQVIQHWNRVYGYTAHHLGLRLTKAGAAQGQRQSIELNELIPRMEQTGIEVLQATGLYTHQMLEQVFTRPEKNTNIPPDLIAEIAQRGSTLPKVLENGKLLEIVSRLELPEQFKSEWFEFYGLKYQADNPLHSAPLYTYFLPAQAAHVIRTSIQTQ